MVSEADRGSVGNQPTSYCMLKVSAGPQLSLVSAQLPQSPFMKDPYKKSWYATVFLGSVDIRTSKLLCKDGTDGVFFKKH